MLRAAILVACATSLVSPACGQSRVIVIGATCLRRRRVPFVIMILLAAAAAVVGILLAVKPINIDNVVIPENARKGTPIWERADDAGIAGTSLLAPLSFPSRNLRNG